MTPNATPAAPPQLEIHGSVEEFNANGDIFARGVTVSYNGVTISADVVQGNSNQELVFSGHAQISTRSVTTYADAIHFFPPTRRYRLENARSIVPPDLLQRRLTEPLNLTGKEIYGTGSGYTLGQETTETTCIEPFHHYELRSRDIILIPEQRIVLHQTGVYLFGTKLITIPYIVIPLDTKAPKRPRTNYLPEFGENVQEGYYVRFPYEFPIGQKAAAYVQVSETQRLGPRLRGEIEYEAGKQASPFNTSGAGFGGGSSGGIGASIGSSGAFNSAFGYGQIGPSLPRLGVGLGPASGGIFTIQGYTNDGFFNRNFSTSFRHQQSIGGGNRFGFSTELQKQSYLSSSNQTTQNTRFDFAHDDNIHGVNALASLNVQTTDSNTYSSRQITGSLRDAYTFDVKGANRNLFSFQADVSDLLNLQNIAATTTTPASKPSTTTARIDTQFQFQHTAREYSYTFGANKDTPFGAQSPNSSFGTLEKLPEFQLMVDTTNFKGGDLKVLPMQFLMNLGRYNEPSTQIDTERMLFNLNIPQITIMKGRTELVTGGGFEQRFYGDGAAEYITRDNTRLRQHLGGRSGIDLNYTYEQPAGGTPFAFDAFNRSHYITAEAGYLDDRNFQATLKTGYDLTGRSPGLPWQTVAGHLMWRPNSGLRFDATSTFDPNTGKFISITGQTRIRGPQKMAIDLVTRIDPSQRGIRRKFSQINTQFDIPFKGGWRVAGLLRFNGVTGLFDSRAAEIIHEWDCLEASFTYSENPNSYLNDRQFYFAIRIKGLPATRNFYRGPSGEALGVGVGDIY